MYNLIVCFPALIIYLFVCLDQHIDVQTLPLLDEKSIEELIAKVGVRVRLLHGWREEVSCASSCQNGVHLF